MFHDYLLQFRGLSGDDLLALQKELQEQRTIYSQQGQGGKSMSRDLRLLNDQLTAIQYVLNERAPKMIVKPIVNLGVGIANFGGVRE